MKKIVTYRTANSWTKKRGERHYGYNCHTKVDKRTKLIETFRTTTAKVHDSQVTTELLEEKDKGQSLYMDAGYVGTEKKIEDYGMLPVICERGYRNHPLTNEQKQSNKEKSKIRSRVEHVFGFIEGAMHGALVRSIGMVRVAANVALTCLVYNIFRYAQLHKYGY